MPPLYIIVMSLYTALAGFVIYLVISEHARVEKCMGTGYGNIRAGSPHHATRLRQVRHDYEAELQDHWMVRRWTESGDQRLDGYLFIPMWKDDVILPAKASPR